MYISILFAISLLNKSVKYVKSMELFTILDEVEGPRMDHLKEHSITTAAVIGGAKSWYEVEEF